MAGHSQIVVVGSANADLTVHVARRPVPGETVLGEKFTVTPGGKGANQAVAAARMGASVLMVGAVGDDEYTNVALSGLRAAGVDLSRFVVSAAQTGIAVITVGDDADNSIVVIPGANATIDAAAVSAHADILAQAGVVIVQGEIPRSGIEAAARLAGGRLIVNLAPVVEVDAGVLRRADPLVVNEHEGVLALEQLVGPLADTPDEAGTVRQLIAAGVTSVVLTCGSHGAFVGRSDGDRLVLDHVPALRVTAVDTTGAGDAFVGALGRSLAAGEDLLAAARYATRVAAFSIQSSGAQPSYPDQDSTLPGE